MSLLRLIVLFFILVSPPASKLWGAQPSNHFTFRTLYASEDRFSYDNLYLLYRLRLAPVPEVAAGITLVKGCGEGGCGRETGCRDAVGQPDRVRRVIGLFAQSVGSIRDHDQRDIQVFDTF